MAGENAAVLIDADNARPAITEGMLAEVAKYGLAGPLPGIEVPHAPTRC